MESWLERNIAWLSWIPAILGLVWALFWCALWIGVVVGGIYLLFHPEVVAAWLEVARGGLT